MKAREKDPKNNQKFDEKSGHEQKSKFLAVIGLLITFGVFSSPPFDSLTYTNLLANMAQHAGMLIFSAVFGYGFSLLISSKKSIGHEKGRMLEFYSMLSSINKRTRGLIFSVLLPSLLIVFWNLPWNFDLASTELPAHILQDISYMISGLSIGFAIPAIPRKLRIALLWIFFMQLGMMGSMMLVWEPGFYSAYPPYQNQLMNTIMMLTGAAGVSVTSIYLLKEMDIL